MWALDINGCLDGRWQKVYYNFYTHFQFVPSVVAWECFWNLRVYGDVRLRVPHFEARTIKCVDFWHWLARRATLLSTGALSRFQSFPARTCSLNIYLYLYRKGGESGQKHTLEQSVAHFTAKREKERSEVWITLWKNVCTLELIILLVRIIFMKLPFSVRYNYVPFLWAERQNFFRCYSPEG